MTYIKKNYFILLLSVYFVFGVFYCLNVGLSFDEFHEQRNWEFNVALVKNIIFKSELDPKFINYGDKYFGVGFQILSQPIQFFLSNIILEFQNIDKYGSHLLAKHFVVFISFFISGIFVYLIISKIINNKYFCHTATFLYLLYPYLFGHGLFNPKDIPFLSFWIICTYVSINIFEKYSKDRLFKYRDIILISFLSAFLLSIRISGVLIFLQYLITVTIFLSSEKENFKSFIKNSYKKFLSFAFLTIFFTYILYPVFWKNPLLVFDAIEYMSNYFNNVCTLTLGKCMYSKDLDPTYIPIWLLVKLPMIILIGLILLPFTEKKIFVSKEKNIVIGTLLVSSLLIPAILILKKVHLYDELRQILFLIPMIFILGVVSLYIFSKKIFYLLSIITLFVFLIENIKIYPFQYAWFNTPSRVLELSKNFELDYWGLSSREIAKHISKLHKQEETKPCILTIWSAKPFLDSKLYNCFGAWSLIDSNVKRPFLAIQNVRNLKKGKTYRCESVYESKFNLLFSKEEIITGKLIKCI